MRTARTPAPAPCFDDPAATVMKRYLITGVVLMLMTAAWLFRHDPVTADQTPAARSRPAPMKASVPASPPAVAALPSAAPAVVPTPSIVAAPAEASAPPAEPPDDNPDQAREWARQDPARATRWLAHAPPGEVRDAVAEIVCAEVASFDPAEAVTLAARYAVGNLNLLENLVQQWAAQDAPAAAAYAREAPPGEVRNRLLARVAFTLAHTTPAEAAQLAIEQIEPGAVQDDAVISVLHQWALTDPSSALAWAQHYSPAALRDRALRELNTVQGRRP